MIFPGDLYPRNFKPDFSPAWVLSLLNIAVFVFIIAFDSVGRNESDKAQDLSLFANQVDLIKNIYEQSLDPIERKTLKNIDLQTMLRDTRFWYRLENREFKGDQVKITEARDFFSQLKKNYFTSPQYLFGLSQDPTSPFAWISYQFLHTSFLHLLVNLIFLFLVTQSLQTLVSDEWVYSIYILSGISGGVFYLSMSNSNDIAVLGASGAICGLMAFLVLVQNTKNIKWSYFLSPLKGHYGHLYLPAFLIFPIYLISDFTTVIINNNGVTASIANSAHVGGTLCGLMLGAYYLYDQRFKKYILNQFKDHLTAEEYDELRKKVS